MNWNSSVWLYCERGVSTDLLAEPANAISSLIYVLGALFGLWIYRRLTPDQRSADHMLLILLLGLVGIGSLLFHLFANQWSELFHIVPIFLFLLVYQAYAFNRFLDMPVGWVGFVSGLFVMLSLAALTMTCSTIDGPLQPSWADGGATSCLNGSLAYIPAALILLFIGYLSIGRSHKAAFSSSMAAVLFVFAIISHALDHLYCNELVFWGNKVGGHAFWHLLSGISLFLLLRATMKFQNTISVQEIIPPSPKPSRDS